MIEFKVNVEDLLPYNRKQYKAFKGWYCVSFQLPGVFEGLDIGLKLFREKYIDWFKNLILNLDTGAPWIANHDFIDEEWIPNNQNNLKALRTLFVQNKIPFSFKGAIIFNLNELLEFARDIISYPNGLFNRRATCYCNIDLSHSEKPIIIKISAHLCIDILTRDLELLKQIVKDNYLDYFVLKPTWGTKL